MNEGGGEGGRGGGQLKTTKQGILDFYTTHNFVKAIG